MPADTIPELSAEQLAEIERKYDPETAFRATGKILGFGFPPHWLLCQSIIFMRRALGL